MTCTRTVCSSDLTKLATLTLTYTEPTVQILKHVYVSTEHCGSFVEAANSQSTLHHSRTHLLGRGHHDRARAWRGLHGWHIPYSGAGSTAERRGGERIDDPRPSTCDTAYMYMVNNTVVSSMARIQSGEDQTWIR